MKKTLLLLLLFSTKIWSQTPAVSLFQPIDEASYAGVNLREYITNYSLLSPDTLTWQRLLQERPDYLIVTLPFEGGMTLELEQSYPLSPDFILTASNGSGRLDTLFYQPGLHYAGKVIGMSHSLVAISIYEDQIMGVISDEESNINLGRVNTEVARAESIYVMFRDKYVIDPPKFECGISNDQVMEIPVEIVKPDIAQNNLPVNACPVRVFLDCDFGLFLSNGSNIGATTNMAVANFNVAKTVYSNENVAVEVSEINVWTINDPFINGNSNLALVQLRDYYNVNGINGNFAMLLQPENIGGVSFIDAICINNQHYGVSGNINYPNPYPNFTYGAQVLTHELGHSMGSPHTHWCGWPGGAIDGCWFTEGGCPLGPPPVNGGTIMSYCALHPPYSFPLSNGLGPLPGNLIRNKVTYAPCLKSLSDENNNPTVCGCTPDPADVLELVNLYWATGGSHWINNTNWLNYVDYNWFGIRWGKFGDKCKVLQINLDNNQVFGQMPNLILSNLKVLKLGNNELFGSIPDFNLPELELLFLYNNHLNGPIPNFNLPNLKNLSLFSNQLSGPIPNFNLPNLGSMSLANNHLLQSIPNFNLPNLNELNLNNNYISGSLPDFNLPKLSYLYASNNNISGEIPNFNLPNLKSLYLESNKLEGKMPNFFLPELEKLYLSGNNLSGNFPNLNLPNLKNLSCSLNSLSGSLPALNLPNLQSFEISYNEITSINTGTYLLNLKDFRIVDNMLDYSALYQLFPNSFQVFLYWPQAKVPVFTTPDCSALYVKAGGNVAHNTYKWFEDSGLYLGPIVGDSLFVPVNPGRYYCRIENSYVNSFVAGVYFTSETVQKGSTFVSISGANSFCSGDSITLNANTGYSNYTWNTGATGQSITVGAPGTYTVTVSVGPGCTGTAQATVTSVAYPQPTIQSSNPSICSGSTATLNAGSGYGTYLWSNGKTTQSIEVTQPGIYTVTVTNAPGCSGTANYILNSLSAAVPIITGAIPICPGQNHSLNAGSFSTYLWSTGSTSASTVVNQPGTYAVTVTNAAGCTGMASIVVPNNLLSVAVQGNPEICIGGVTVLDAGTGFSNYSWSNGTASRLNEVTAQGVYVVTVSNAQGCTGVASVDVGLISNPAPTPDIQGLIIVCGSPSTTLAADTVYSAYSWSTGSTMPNITITQAGTYSITVTDADGCKGKGEITVSFSTSPLPQITGPTALCDGEIGVLNASLGYTDYLWNTGSSDSAISIVQAGTYTVTITNAAGCTGLASWTVSDWGGSMIATPLPSGTASPDFGSSSSYSVTAVNGAEFYTWTPPPGCSINGNPTGQAVTLSAANGTSVMATFGCGYGDLCVLAQGNCISSVPACFPLNYMGAAYGGMPICPNDEPATDDCASACIHLDLDGTTFNNAGYIGEGQTSCGNWESSLWFTFIAPATNFNVIATPGICQNGDGLQMAIFKSCSDNTPLFCSIGQAGGGNLPLNINAAGMIPGQAYYLMIDTWAGDICDFTLKISPNPGFQLSDLPDLSPIQGPLNVCPGELTAFSIPAVPGVQQYTWNAPPGVEINGMNSPVTLDAVTGHTVQVRWALTLGGNLSVKGSNACFAKERSIGINVQQIPITVLPLAIVCSESAPYETPWGAIISTSGTYQTTLTSLNGCDSILQQTVTIKPPIIKNLGQKAICEGDYITVCGEVYSDGGSFTTVCNSYQGCDSTVNFSINVLSPVANITGGLIMCSGDTLTLSSSASPGSTVKKWINGNGQVIGSTNTITVTQPGVYILEASMTLAGVTCTKRDTSVVVLSNNEPLLVDAVGGIIGCASPTVIIGASSDQNVEFSWTGPNNFTSSSAFNNVAAAGTYTVTVSNLDGCTASSTATVTIEDKTGTFLLSSNPSEIGMVPASVTDISIPAIIENQEPNSIEMAWERVFIDLTPGCEPRVQDKIAYYPTSVSMGAFSLAQDESAPLKIHLTDSDTSVCCGVVRLLCRNTCTLRDTTTMVYIAGCLVGIYSPEFADLQIVPNPGSGLFQVIGQIPEGDIYLKVFAIDGKKMLDEKLSSAHTFSLESDPSGVYIAVFEDHQKHPVKAVELILQK